MFIKNVQNFAFQNGLWEKGARIVVGVSGGADSVCLLHMLKTLAKKYEFSLHIAHVNYSLRGKDSERDEEFVQKLAHSYGLPVTVFSFNKASGRKHSEEELRAARYAFFEQLRSDLGFDLIAVAHSQDDQAETVLLRLIRGTGLMGLSAMKAKNGNIIRPLLVLSRKQILEYLKKHSLEYRLDKTNAQAVFARNKVRLKLLPRLEKDFNPRIKENLNLLALIAGDDYDFLLKKAVEALEFSEEKNGLSFRTAWLEKLHPSLQRNCLRLLVSKTKEDLAGIEASHIEEILKIAKSRKNKAQKASFRGLNITRKGAKVYMLSAQKS